MRKSSFWLSDFGIFLRWILFVPSGMLIKGIIEMLIIYSLTTFTMMGAWGKIISLFLCGSLYVGMFVGVYFAGFFTGKIAPHKLTGAIILTLIFLVGIYRDISIYYLPDNTGSTPRALYLISKILILVLFTAGMWIPKKEQRL